jgi:hypothetical protein
LLAQGVFLVTVTLAACPVGGRLRGPRVRV